MSKTVYLSELAPVCILFPGDFRELASFLLRGFDSLTQGTNAKSRPTMHGVSSAYVRLFIDLDLQKIEGRLRQMGFDLGASVEWDERAAEPLYGL